MQLTRAADYALRAMIHLAGMPQGRRVSSSELAGAAAVSETFLSKVLQKLVARGLVTSYRGQGGGFQLNISASEISVLEIVEAIEGPIVLNCCTSPADHCDRQGWCAAHRVWAEAQTKVKEVLGAAKLDRMARESAETRAALQSGDPKWAALN
jgi:Rrf2 family iron-sulfur cluster assembly transcriptional regulator